VEESWKLISLIDQITQLAESNWSSEMEDNLVRAITSVRADTQKDDND